VISIGFAGVGAKAKWKFAVKVVSAPTLYAPKIKINLLIPKPGFCRRAKWLARFILRAGHWRRPAGCFFCFLGKNEWFVLFGRVPQAYRFPAFAGAGLVEKKGFVRAIWVSVFCKGMAGRRAFSDETDARKPNVRTPAKPPV